MSTYDVALVGGSGFVAGHLLESFNRNGLRILVLGRVKPPQIAAKDFIYLDLASQTFTEIFAKHPGISFDTLIFNSGIKARFEKDTPEWKVQGLVTAPEFTGLPPFKRLMTIGSSEEYGPFTDATLISETTTPRPLSSYGQWKLNLYENGLQWSKKTGGQFIHLRPFNIIGPGADPKMLVGAVIRSLLGNNVFKMTAGEPFRSFLSVTTLVKAVEALLRLPTWDEFDHLLNVSEPHYLKIKDMVELLQKKINSGDVVFGAVPYRQDEVWHQNPNLGQLKKLLGENYYQPLEETIDEMIESIRSGEKPS